MMWLGLIGGILLGGLAWGIEGAVVLGFLGWLTGLIIKSQKQKSGPGPGLARAGAVPDLGQARARPGPGPGFDHSAWTLEDRVAWLERRVVELEGRLAGAAPSAAIATLPPIPEPVAPQPTAAGADPSSAEETAIFDSAWAESILSSALNQVHEKFSEAGRAKEFGVLKQFLPGSGDPPSYEVAAQQMRITVAALTSEIHRLRQALRECVRSEVAGTVSAPHEIDEEMAYLHRVLANPAMDFARAEKVDGADS